MKHQRLIMAISSTLLLILLIVSSSVQAVFGQASTPTFALPDLASIGQTATALSTFLATVTPTDMPTLGKPVDGKQWRVTAHGTSSVASIVDVFGNRYNANAGQSILLVSISVQNLGTHDALPDAEMLVSGIKFYSSAKAPVGAFDLSKLAVYSDQGERFGLVGFGVGNNRQFVIASNLTDLSAAFDGTDPVIFTLAFGIPEKTTVNTLTFEFEDLPRIALQLAPTTEQLKLTATNDPNAVTTSGTFYASRAKNVALHDVEVDLNDPSQDVKSPAYKVATTKTDKMGKFTFSNVKPGRYLLSATFALSKVGALQCPFSGGITFKDDWLVALGTDKAGAKVIIAINEFEQPIVAGDTVVADLDLACN